MIATAKLKRGSRGKARLGLLIVMAMAMTTAALLPTGSASAATSGTFPNVAPVKMYHPTAPQADCSFTSDPPGVNCGFLPADPYPSSIAVGGMTGPITDVNVTLNDLWQADHPAGQPGSGDHGWTADIDILLVAPDGTNLVLMSDACGDSENAQNPIPLANAIDLTFDDAAASQLPQDTACTSGTFKPTDDDNDSTLGLPGRCDTGPGNEAKDCFSGPGARVDPLFYTTPPKTNHTPTAPEPVSANTTLAAFNGKNANGAWRLYMLDDYPAGTGSSDMSPPQPALTVWGGLNTGWSLQLTTSGASTGAKVADFNGDGDTDVSVFRPSTSTWYTQDGLVSTFGTTGDIQVPGDYDGDGDTDVAVFRPSNGLWFVQGGSTVAWGASGDIPVPADYDGNGTTDRAVFRPSTGVWYIHGGASPAWGTSGDIPVPADYDGNGTTDIAVYRPSTGTWFIRNGPTVVWGAPGDIPVPGDYNGNGAADIAVFRPSSGLWLVNGISSTAWGTSGDIPVPGDYNANGTTDLAVFRPSTGVWFINGVATVQFGGAGDRPLPLPHAILSVFFP